jgi:hypothetical protein
VHPGRPFIGGLMAIFILIIIAGLGYYLYKVAKPLPKEPAVVPAPPPPPRPMMPPIKDGLMSVGIQQTDEAVWLYIEVSEVTKHILSQTDAGLTTVDETNPDRTEYLEKDIAFYKRLYHDDPQKRDEAIRSARKMYTAPIPVLLKEILRDPYRHPVKNTVEAVEYVAHLKKSVLPRAKAAIEAHLRPKTETFQL